MPFEFAKFPGAGRGFSPRASLRKNGQIGFNNGAVTHYRLQDFCKVILYYDEAHRAIGIQPTNDDDDRAACPLIHRPGNSYVSARSFFEWFGIPIAERTARYELRRDDESGVLVIEVGTQVGKRVEAT